MDFQLKVVAGPDTGQVFELKEKEILQIGRGPETQTKLRDPRVSRNHCHVTVADGTARVVDPGSTTGTFVNGLRVDERELHEGDVIRVGGTQLKLQRFDKEGTTTWMKDEIKPSPDLLETREMGTLRPPLNKLDVDNDQETVD